MMREWHESLRKIVFSKELNICLVGLLFQSLLQQSEAAAYYSEYFFDRRLTRSGKAQFSIADFKLGLDGAIETLTRLLRICSLPFYRRYGRYLGESFGPVSNQEQG